LIEILDIFDAFVSDITLLLTQKRSLLAGRGCFSAETAEKNDYLWRDNGSSMFDSAIAASSMLFIILV